VIWLLILSNCEAAFEGTGSTDVSETQSDVNRLPPTDSLSITFNLISLEWKGMWMDCIQKHDFFPQLTMHCWNKIHVFETTFLSCFLFCDEFISWHLPFHFAIAVFGINVKPCHQPYGHTTLQGMKSDLGLRSWARTCGLKPRVSRISNCFVNEASFHSPTMNYRRIMILFLNQNVLFVFLFYFFLTRDGGQTAWIKWIHMGYILVRTL